MSKSFSLDALKSDLKHTLSNFSVDIDKLEAVLTLAYQYHEGQFREHKDGGDKRIPYITHPVGVAKNCAVLWQYAQLDDSLDDILSAALTHDLLEDTSVEIDELESTTSPRTADLVQALTKPTAKSSESRTERNKAFLKAISTHSPSAKFIKLCDALHNLSRPSSMPATLLAKTISKAKRDYLPLATDKCFSSEIRKRLEASIEEAETKLKEISPKTPRHSTFEVFLTYCIERASGKTLEPHDILDILLELPGLSLVHDGSISSFTEQFLTDFMPSGKGNQYRLTADKLVEEGVLTLSGKAFERDKIKSLSYQRIFALPYDSASKDLAHRGYFFIAQTLSKSLDWISVAYLKAIIAILSERKKEHDARELSDYVNWIATTNLIIDPRLAAELKLSRMDILRLAQFSDAAEVKIGAIISGMELMCRQVGLTSETLLVEHRIKTASSIASKLIKRLQGDWEKIDDIIGLRLVMLNEKAVAKLVNEFEYQINQDHSLWALDIGLIKESFSVRDVKSSNGYRGTHITFHVRNALQDVQSVPCEIQVRTVFQDAWARIAHSIQYKSTTHVTNRMNKNLKQLAKKCEEVDTMANELTHYNE